jgi:hypothetical protein
MDSTGVTRARRRAGSITSTHRTRIFHLLTSIHHIPSDPSHASPSLLRLPLSPGPGLTQYYDPPLNPSLCLRPLLLLHSILTGDVTRARRSLPSRRRVVSRSSLYRPDLIMFDAVETFEDIEAAEYANVSVVCDAELIERVSVLASSPIRDDEVREAANSFEQAGSSSSQNTRCLYIQHISIQFACQKSMKSNLR